MSTYERKIMRKVLIALAAVAALVGGVVFASPAQAAFYISCNLSDGYAGRFDFDDIERSAGHQYVDSSGIRYTTIRRPASASTQKADAVWVQLYDAVSGSWVAWTTRGGTATDSSEVASGYYWDPNGRSDSGANYTHFRGQVWMNGLFCRTISYTLP